MALPFIWVMILGILYLEWATQPLVRAVVIGVGAAGAGLLIGTSLKLARALVKNPAALVLIAGCFLSVGVGRASMLIVMPLAAAIGVFCARRDWL
jgi:chromate transport protein ChrA